MKKIKLITVLMVIALIATLFSACVKCTHEYKNGSCINCGEACVHEFSQGACTVCELPCSHVYQNGVCEVCEIICTHTYQNGVCTICRMPCPHDYENGTCKTCETVCTHEVYINGICAECSIVCDHDYINGICRVCNMECNHTYQNGYCTICGEPDPDWFLPDGGESLYNAIVARFKNLILYKYINEELPPKGSNEPFYVDALYEVAEQYDPSIEMGYSFKDLNDDGFVELLLTGRESRVYALFSLVNKQPVVVKTFQQGLGYITNDGLIFYNFKLWDGVAQIELQNHVTRLVEGELVGFEYGWVDADSDSSTTDDTNYYKVENGQKISLTHEDYVAYKSDFAYFWDYPTRLSKLANLKFNSALTDTIESAITADFSTYDEIILTFSLMYSNVAYGKFERSFWTSGRYDNKMLFNSDEDFYIYNSLIGACVLAQESTSPNFGYALKDLNADGVDELILLESNYYVLAIFTQVDGKAILLDTFTDLKSACIDANGLIHVKQRVLPGTEKDAEYFVYQVNGGKLISQIAIGTKYSSYGFQNAWYKFENGEKITLTQNEWNTLYMQYLGNIGSTQFNVYTKKNAGLTFVSISTNE